MNSITNDKSYMIGHITIGSWCEQTCIRCSYCAAIPETSTFRLVSRLAISSIVSVCEVPKGYEVNIFNTMHNKGGRIQVKVVDGARAEHSQQTRQHQKPARAEQSRAQPTNTTASAAGTSRAEQSTANKNTTASAAGTSRAL